MREITIPEQLKRDLPHIVRTFATARNLANAQLQKQLRMHLMRHAVWASFINENFRGISLEPYHIRAGLGIGADDATARSVLVGLALCIEPASYVPPYRIEGLAVTEVIAASDATKESHSKNDLPAPPHVAGFFEKTLPHTCYFACIRPHERGGGETTVANLDMILKKAPSTLIQTWKTKTYYLRTSKAMGNSVKPFRLLQEINGLPFFRYRKEYTEKFADDPSLVALEQFMTDSHNHYRVRLASDEILVHWNGAPHSRLPQIGPTPEDVSGRRKLIRCRTRPYDPAWNNYFASG